MAATKIAKIKVKGQMVKQESAHRQTNGHTSTDATKHIISRATRSTNSHVMALGVVHIFHAAFLILYQRVTSMLAKILV